MIFLGSQRILAENLIVVAVLTEILNLGNLSAKQKHVSINHGLLYHTIVGKKHFGVPVFECVFERWCSNDLLVM